MEAAVYDIARNGDGVIIGHGSQMFLRDFACAFHVRLFSDFNSRVENLVSKQGMKRDVAENIIAQYDKSQKAFSGYAFPFGFILCDSKDRSIHYENALKVRFSTLDNTLIHYKGRKTN